MSKTKELFNAIYSNNIENVKIALSEGADLNSTFADYGHSTPLMAAAGAWNTGILEFLIEQGADVKVKTPDGDTILSLMVGQAFSSGTRVNEQYHNLIRKIISKGVDVDSYNQNGDNNPLLVSMSSADIETVDMLIEAGANLNIIVHKDNPDVPLNRAISQLVRMRPDAEYIIDKMIAKGANVNPKAENLRSSPLSSAIVEGREDIFNKLIGHGADINHACSSTTPLISAILMRNNPMVEKLLDMRAHINPENTNLAYSPLSMAISIGDSQLFQWLITEGANVAPKNVQITPIAQAIASDMVDVLELMLSFGSIPDQQIVDGLLWNMHKCDSPSFNLALGKVTDINLPSQLGQTLLGRAIFTPEEKLSVLAQKLILEHKAKLQFNEFSSLVQLAHRPNSEGMSLINLILKTTDDQAVKLEGMNVVLENMLKCVNGVNIELLKIFIEHGLTISPSNIKLALDHQNLPHPVYPNYINEMLEIIFNNIDLIHINEPIDQQNNSLCMMLGQNDAYHMHLTKLLNIKNLHGLHIVKVNMTNQQGQKLIDIIADKLELNNGMNYMEIVKLLRHVGSVEPKKPIVPTSMKLDISNVHNQRNEKPVTKIQTKLSGKFLLTEENINEVFILIEEYIATNEARIKDLLNDGQSNVAVLFSEMMAHLESIKCSDEVHNDHNNQWILKREVANTFLEIKEQNLSLDGLVHVISLRGSCPWGKLVNLYKLVEVVEGEIKPIDMGPVYKNSDWFANQIMEKLTELSFSEAMKKHVIKKFYNDIKEFKSNSSSYSLETQLVVGLVSDSFIKFITNIGRDESDIYSIDFANVILLAKGIQGNFEFADQGDNNLYDLLLTINQQDNSHDDVAVIGDGNDDF